MECVHNAQVDAVFVHIISTNKPLNASHAHQTLFSIQATTSVECLATQLPIMIGIRAPV